MPDTKAYILATRQLDSSWTEKAREKGIVLDMVSFIKTESILSIEVQQEIEQAATQYATVVFTSAAAVEAVTELLEGAVPEWSIYCIGYHTREKVQAYFGAEKLGGTATTASALADDILAHADTDEVIFFAGNKRRNELPDKLRANGMEVNEITVYQTALTPQEITRKYDGILFFSPSTVESFYIKNKMPETTIAFAIGSSTAETISRHFPNKIIVSNTPVKNSVVQLALDHFSP
ncbi:MAG TPA: uroporphyrinogen-III synthase [Sediminibacterium sp.]|jgi:uroporphyrinogen-III synthase